MFGFGFRPFEEDPFFRDHHERMRQAFGGFGGFDRNFGQDPFALQGPHNESQRPQDGRNIQHPGMDSAVAPMNMFGGGMMGMGSMFHNMEQQFARAANDPNSFSYTQSSVMSYSNDGRGEPKYFQAHHSTKRAPGGVKETKNAVKDSDTGLQRMAVGHHIGDRGHVVERSLNRRTGEEQRKQDFINMDEGNANQFQQEWTTKTRDHAPTHLDDRRRHRHRALEDSSHGRRDRSRERLPEHDRERRIRHQHRPVNRHAPRGGLD